MKKGNELVPAPQLRCPAEITYVFKNEPKVKEIVKKPFKLKKGETVKLTFEKLGISKNTDSFLMELEAKVEETSMLRYPYTLFHSTMPDKTAHMYGKNQNKRGEIVMLKILFQGDSLTDCGRDKTGHNPVQAYGYGYVNLIASKLFMRLSRYCSME